MNVSVKPANGQFVATIKNGVATVAIPANLIATGDNGQLARIWAQDTDGLEVVIPHEVLVRLADMLGEKPPAAPRAPAKPKGK